jgi:hypothetical protein
MALVDEYTPLEEAALICKTARPPWPVKVEPQAILDLIAKAREADRLLALLITEYDRRGASMAETRAALNPGGSDA